MAAEQQPSQQSNPPSKTRWGLRWWLVAALAVIVVAGGTVVVVGRVDATRAASTPVPGPGTATADAPAPLKVVTTTPAAGSTGVPSDASLSVQFNDPVAPDSPTPTLSPAVAGTWELLTPTTFTFVADGPLVPSTGYTLTVPADTRTTSGGQLGTAVTATFTVADGGTLRLQQLLASLGYLPVAFTPAGPLAAPQEAAEAQAGSFSWRFTVPDSLTSLWTPGESNVVTKGAVMAFESQHDMTTDGSAGPAVWQALLAASAAGAMDPAPYDYVYVNQQGHETATVYKNGAEVYSTAANTGVAGARTGVGTFPVYARYLTTTMTGTNPDGSHYSDPGIPWVSYFNGGDALHGFVRGSYGFPQSDGCVEMPPSNAEVVYPLTPIGTLVTVSSL